MSLLTQASLVLTPNAYKANKLYSIIPSSGNGDMTTTRATTATRINSSGLVENVATGIPRVDYTSGVANILLEPQRTNLLLNSVWAGGGTIPTSWAVNFQTGTSTPIQSIKNPNVSAYRFITSTQRQEFNQSFSLALNSVNTLSVYVESAPTPIIVSQMLRVSSGGVGTGTSVFLKNNVIIASTENITQGNTYSLQFTCTLVDTFQARVGCGVIGNVTGDITLSMPQLEVGSYATSYIPTTTSTVTRNGDSISLSNIYTNNFITSAGGTWFYEIDNNFSLIRDAGSNGIFIGDNSNPNNGFRIRAATLSSEKLIIEKVISFTSSLLYTTLTNRIKVAIDWNGTTADIFVNGVKVVTATSFPFLAMQLLSINAIDVPKYIRQIALFPTPLTDAECITLTTL